MEIALVKAAGPGDRDRAYLQVDGVTRRDPKRQKQGRIVSGAVP